MEIMRRWGWGTGDPDDEVVLLKEVENARDVRRAFVRHTKKDNKRGRRGLMSFPHVCV